MIPRDCVILMDVDGTLVDPRRDAPGGDLRDWFEGWLLARDAEPSHFHTAQNEGVPLDEIVDAAGLSREQFYGDLTRWMSERVEALEGARELIKGASQCARELHLASTNAEIIARAKLAGAGLDPSRFKGLRGGDEILPGGKSSPVFFRALMQRIGVSAEQVIHIGNDATADGLFSSEAGVAQCLLLQPPQPAAVPLESGRVRVFHSLREIIRWFRFSLDP